MADEIKEIELSESEVKKIRDLENSINALKIKHSNLRDMFLSEEQLLRNAITSLNNDKTKDIQYILSKNNFDPTTIKQVNIDYEKKILKL